MGEGVCVSIEGKSWGQWGRQNPCFVTFLVQMGRCPLSSSDS